MKASHSELFLYETRRIAERIPHEDIERMALELSELHGTLWIAGLGGSAANASHATNDFRKLCGMDVRCLSDNVAEVTARANDEGWETIFSAQLEHATVGLDALMVLSVGGGTHEVSLPLVRAIDRAKSKSMKVFGIVGRDGGHTKQKGDCVIVIPTVNDERVTPHAEGWQGVILHCLVSHPSLQIKKTKW